MNPTHQKRFPIKQKVRRVVLSVTFSSLFVAGIVGLSGMLIIRSNGISSLLNQTEENLLTTVVSKATHAELELERLSDYGQQFAQYAHNIYVNKQHFKPNPVLMPDPVNAGKYAIQRCIASEDYHLADFKQEMDLLGNLEQVYESVIKAYDSMKINVYAGFESGFLIGYDEDSGYDGGEPEEDYYNFFESSWYQNAKELQNTFFTDVYQDSIGRGLMISCAVPFYNEKNIFAGAFCLDIHIENLYRALIDVSSLSNSTAFLIDRQGNAISEGSRANIYADASLDAGLRTRLKDMETGVCLTDDGVYYAFAPILATDWELCICVPKKSVMAPIQVMDRHIFYSIFFFVLILLVMIVLVLFVTRAFATSLTHPLEELTKDVQEISKGNLDKKAQVFANDEIGDVANGVNAMAASLKEYIANLTSVTAEKERITNELNVANQVQEFYSKVLDAMPDGTPAPDTDEKR